MSALISPRTERNLAEPDRGVPPLQSGDVLSRAEFERRYTAHPEIKKAELIEGVVYVSSPLFAAHGEVHSAIDTWLGLYWSATPGIRVLNNVSVRLDADNEVQPDVSVFVDPRRTLPNDTYIETAPTLVVEVAVSTASYDLHQKLAVYRRNGVAEYLVLAVHEQETRWHRWREGVYELLEPGQDGILRSEVLPGLWLHAQRLWARDLAGVLEVLQQGLATPEHAAFVEALEAEEKRENE